MTDGTHDVSLITLIVDSVAHGFSINGQRVILLRIALVPALQCTVEMCGVHADQDIADDGQARDDVALVLAATPEALASLLAQAVGPIRDGQVATHATQDRAGGNG